MKKLPLNFVLFTLFVFQVMTTSAQNVRVEPPPLKLPPFITFPAPTTGFRPGYVFRIEKGSKEQVPVTTVGQKSDYDSSAYVLPSITAKWKTNIFVNFVLTKIFGFSFKRNSEKLIRASFAGGKLEQLFEDKIDKLLRSSNINFKPNSAYYIINQTLSFDSIDYKMHDYKTFDADARNYIDSNKVKANVTVNLEAGDTVRLSQHFPEPYRLFYTVIKVTPKGTQVSGGRKFDFSKTDMILTDKLLLQNK